MNDEREFVSAESLVAQVRRVPGEKSKAHIHPTFLQSRLDFGRGNFFNVQTDLRMICGEQAEQLRHQGDI